MLIDIAQPLLYKALQAVSRAVSSQSVIPTLSGIKVQADAAGLSLTAGQTGLLLHYHIPCDNEQLQIKQMGSVVIPAYYLIHIVRHLPTGSLSLGSNEDLKVVIQGGKAVYHLCGMDAELFPQVAQNDRSHTISFPNGSLKKIIDGVSFAISSSQARPVLTGVACIREDDQVKWVATDGVRLASRITPIKNTALTTAAIIIIPGKHLIDFSRMLNDELATTDICIQDHMIVLKTGSLFMQSSLLEGSYPCTDRLKPDSFSTEITLDRNDFLRALERVTLLAGDSDVVKLDIISYHKVELSSKTTAVGDVIEEVDMEACMGDAITIYFNGNYMIDIIGAVDCSKVMLRLNGKWSPIIVQPLNSTDSLYIITPIRRRD